MYFKKINRTIDIEKIKSKLQINKKDIAFIAGSLVESSVGKYSQDIGNEKSDIDIFIIKETLKDQKKIDFDEEFSIIFFKEIDNILLDSVVYTKRDILQIAEIINKTNLKFNERIRNSLKFPGKWTHRTVNEFLNRIFYSIPIQNNSEYNDIISLIDFAKFCKLTKQKYIVSMEGLQIDIVGNLNSNNYDTALFCLRELFIVFAKVVIYDHNELIDRDKWVIPKILSICKENREFSYIVKLYETIFLQPVLEYSYLYKQAKILFASIDDYILEMES